MVTKIMPLGASNTYGMYEDPTSPGGYRGPLQYMLQAQGASFDLVGVDHDGAIKDPDHNGHSGMTIDWYLNPVNQVIYDPHRPQPSHSIYSGTDPVVLHLLDEAQMGGDDVVLLLLGTNNLLTDDAATMLAKMSSLLDLIVNYESPVDGQSPLVELMKLQPLGADPTSKANQVIRAYNAGLESLVTTKYGSLGVAIVDSGVLADELADAVHMNPEGYRKTAAAWYDSLLSHNWVEFLPLPERPHLIGSTAESSSRPVHQVETGDSGFQRIVGTKGRDLLDGGPGGDAMRGRGQDDTYVVDHQGDRVLERAGGGTDTVRAALGTYVLARHVENVVDSEGLRSRFFGNAGDNILRGGKGRDLLDGDRGADRLIGGAGADVFVLRAGEAQDDSLQFRAGDQIRLAGFGPGAVLVENHTPTIGADGQFDPKGDWSISYRGGVEVIHIAGAGSLDEGTDYVFV